MVVTIILAVAAVAVLAAIVVVATGGGGELSVEHPDHPPLALPGRRAAGGTDAALLRLPMGLWGYHKQITDQALERFAHELTERDTRIAVLEQELAEARQRAGADDRPASASGRPAIPAATPPSDAFAASETRTDAPAGSRADDRRAGEPPAPPEPPPTIQDRIVFDPRQVAGRDEISSWTDPGDPQEHGTAGAGRTRKGDRDAYGDTDRPEAGDWPADDSGRRILAAGRDADDVPPWERPGERDAGDAGRWDRPGGHHASGEAEDGR